MVPSRTQEPPGKGEALAGVGGGGWGPRDLLYGSFELKTIF